MSDKILDKTLDLIFSKNNLKYLLILFILALTLRGIVANNVGPNADEMLHAPHAIDFINSGKLQIMDQDPVWFFLTDLSYKIFGVSMFSARFLAVLFGALSVLVLYLIVKNVYNKKIALIASILLTFSSFHILMSLAEMDVAMMFFVLLSILLFIKGLKENNNKYLASSYVFLGIAILVKQIAITFIPTLIIFFIYHKRKNKQKITLKHAFTFFIILLIISLPVLTFNFLLYKDKGLVDLQFSRFLGIATETYAPIAATLKPFSLRDVFFSYESHKPGIIEGSAFFWNFGKLITVLGILGFILSVLRRKKYTLLWFLTFIFPFIFLSGTSILEYHFIFGVPILSIFAALFINYSSNKISSLNIKKNHIIAIILAFVIIFNLYFILDRGVLTQKSEVTKLMSYSKNSIDPDALVIVDNRIFRGRTVWMFNDKHYLEAAAFNTITAQINDIPGTPTTLRTYFIECVTDDCGWGTIASQPELNESMEQITTFFKENANLETTITNRENDPYISVYSGNLQLKDSLLQIADSTHEWFYYPLRFEPAERVFDNYKTNNLFEKFLNLIGHIVLYIEILIALFSIVLVFYLIRKE